MTDAQAKTFGGDFKRFFVRGLVILLPTVLTLWIVVKAYQFVDNNIAQPINRGLQTVLVQTSKVWEPAADLYATEEEFAAALHKRLATLPESERSKPVKIEQATSALRSELVKTWWTERWYMNLIGIVVAIVAVYMAGRLLGGFFGRRLYKRIEGLITSLPVFKQVYPYVKQIVDFLFNDDKPLKFNRVVAVEYPRKGIWSVGFMTGGPLKSVAKKVGDSVTVFIPSSPTPFTGYTITISRDDLIELPLTVEEAIRFAVSGGVLVPDHQVHDPKADEGLEAAHLPTGLIPLPGSLPSSSKMHRDDAVPDEATPRKDAG